PGPPAGRAALLPMPHRHAADARPAVVPRLHALSREHPRIEHRSALHRAMTMRLRHGIATLAALLVLSAAPAAVAGPLDEYDLGAGLTTGYRNVDIDGSKDKYYEDYNLRSGLRLFHADASATAKDPTKSSRDRFNLFIDTPGDEPISTYHLDAADREKWDFRANFTRSKYFYDVPQLFEAPVPGDDRIDDLEDFDVIRPNRAIDLHLRTP